MVSLRIVCTSTFRVAGRICLIICNWGNINVIVVTIILLKLITRERQHTFLGVIIKKNVWRTLSFNLSYVNRFLISFLYTQKTEILLLTNNISIADFLYIYRVEKTAE
jgi:hypothetical protein